jgi:sugar phosphate isomerase/epimerase
MLGEQNIKKFIIHFDETASLDEMLKIVEDLANKDLTLYIENYFQSDGIQNAEKNLKKFMALFTLSYSHGHNFRVLPVIDIPRFFHQKLQFDLDDSLRWCFQIFNYFGNKRMPMIFHSIDAKDSAQYRTSYCTIGEGYIPYQKIFSFIKKNHYRITGIILEFEDKINALKSRENLLQIFK